MELTEAGMSREEAYRLVQTHAMRAWKEDLVFRELVAAEPEITSKLSPERLEVAFDLHRQLTNVDAIFARVFGSYERPLSADGETVELVGGKVHL